MVNGKFIWCRNCGDIHHVSAFDRAPIFEFSVGEVAEVPANDWRNFMARHASHKLEPLVATGNDYWSHGSAADPMSVVYVEATNGKETLVLRRSRRSIEEPVHYEIVEGRLVETGLRLEVQEREIRKEMKLHHSWSPAAPPGDDKIDLFVALFREVVEGLDPQRVRTSEYSYTDENVSYGHLDPAAVAALLAKCGSYFSPLELESIRRFVEAHRDGCDVMALIKRRLVTIDQHAQ
jgi:hypothetical protein